MQNTSKIKRIDRKTFPRRKRNTRNTQKSQLKSALTRCNRNKVAGPDGIVIEPLVALDNFGIDEIIKVINDICDGGEKP